MHAQQETIGIRMNTGALHLLIEAAECEDLPLATALLKIVGRTLENFDRLALIQGVEVFNEYITQSPEERRAWEERNRENERDNTLAEATFIITEDVFTRLRSWGKCRRFKNYGKGYLVARIIERFAHELAETARRKNLPIELLFADWLDQEK